VLTAIVGKARALVKEEIKIGELGNWLVCTLSHNNKNIVVINIYRIPATLPNGNKCNLM